VTRYETIFILRPDQGEPQIKDAISRYSGIIAAGGGEVVEVEEWGSRELAYRIKGERRGSYIRFDYIANGPVMNEVERNLKISDAVLRYLSVMVDREADAVKAREEVDARNQRLAEARAAAEVRAAALAASMAERAAAAEAQAAAASSGAAASAAAASGEGDESKGSGDESN
jgi:small subunit ribosomal protein S6